MVMRLAMSTCNSAYPRWKRLNQSERLDLGPVIFICFSALYVGLPILLVILCIIVKIYVNVRLRCVIKK